jgi:Skp family chaperone for outer membrane proteins
MVVNCNRLYVAVGLAVLGVVMIAPSYAVWQAAPFKPPVVCTVDLERVFNDIKSRSEAEADLEKDLSVYQDRADELRKDAERLSEDIEALVPGTEKHNEAQKKLTEAALDYGAMVEFMQLKLDSRRAEARRGLFNQIIVAATAYAKANGIDFVLTNDSNLTIQAGTDIQIVQQLALRRVVYANDDFDATDGLIAWMNAP